MTPPAGRRRARGIAWGLAALLAVAGAGGLRAQAPQKYALIIGVSSHRFDGIPELRFAHKDAGDLATALDGLGWEVEVRTDNQARRIDILAALYDYAKKVEPQDTFLLYFAGHGVRNPFTERTYWLTHDAALGFLDSEGIRLSHLMDYVSDVDAGHKIVFLDHCFSGDVDLGGGPGDGERGPGDDLGVIARGVSRTNFNSAVAPGAEGMVVVTAARGVAFESPELENGLFTEALLEALTSPAADRPELGGPPDGSLSVSELVSFVKERVRRLAQDEGFPEQDVVDKLEGEGLVDWVLVPSLPVSGQDEAVTKQAAYLERLDRWEDQNLIDFATRIDCVAVLAAWVRSLADGPPLDAEDAEVLEEIRKHLDSDAPDDILGEDLVRQIRRIRNGGN